MRKGDKMGGLEVDRKENTEGKGYSKLENSVFISMDCKLPRCNTRCCSSSLIAFAGKFDAEH